MSSFHPPEFPDCKLQQSHCRILFRNHIFRETRSKWSSDKTRTISVIYRSRSMQYHHPSHVQEKMPHWATYQIIFENWLRQIAQSSRINRSNSPINLQFPRLPKTSIKVQSSNFNPSWMINFDREIKINIHFRVSKRSKRLFSELILWLSFDSKFSSNELDSKLTHRSWLSADGFCGWRNHRTEFPSQYWSGTPYESQILKFLPSRNV